VIRKLLFDWTDVLEKEIRRKFRYFAVSLKHNKNPQLEQ
jgi:hypothetical protein